MWTLTLDGEVFQTQGPSLCGWVGVKRLCTWDLSSHLRRALTGHCWHGEAIGGLTRSERPMWWVWGPYLAFSIWASVRSGDKNEKCCQLLINPGHLRPIIVMVWHAALFGMDCGLTSYCSNLPIYRLAGFSGWLLEITGWFPELGVADYRPEFYFCILLGHCPLVY